LYDGDVSISNKTAVSLIISFLAAAIVMVGLSRRFRTLLHGSPKISPQDITNDVLRNPGQYVLSSRKQFYIQKNAHPIVLADNIGELNVVVLYYLRLTNYHVGETPVHLDGKRKNVYTGEFTFVYFLPDNRPIVLKIRHRGRIGFGGAKQVLLTPDSASEQLRIGSIYSVNLRYVEKEGQLNVPKMTAYYQSRIPDFGLTFGEFTGKPFPLNEIENVLLNPTGTVIELPQDKMSLMTVSPVP
jgi:hypothetical protein